MYSEEELASAVTAGILSAETATAFRAHVAAARHTYTVDEEQFRLITGFNDIFVVMACALLLISLTWIGAASAPWLGALALMVASWGLAEFFVRQRRMALPAIVLLLSFVGGVYYLGYAFFGRSLTALAFASALAAVAALAHWLRFRVPITVAAGVGAGLGLIIALLFKLVPAAMSYAGVIEFAGGVAVFALAMAWDAADTRRQTRKSDVAFWLHLLAAPLLVQPVFSQLSRFDGRVDLMHALIAIAVYVLIALVSLAIDRRALMASALVYVLVAFSVVLKEFGMVSLGFAFTALLIGSLLLLLSAFWHPCRRWLLGCFPAIALHRLPPLR
ncbi:hypothetical protein BI364_02130 [Acidihalobacter yilgarnensis]|uniref:DUF2157 domain-containing protein n=1 Tax=Acidihalobacter yilgarnensis TaxID=2819280 RepID=A0A1D8IKH0_9GAMM|nr:hypothetical protein [Acidihalobacter yilgarnensis]AOU96965.1 hypothetical protein BI364_02130 [Acidihalobacter yilgarnensis]